MAKVVDLKTDKNVDSPFEQLSVDKLFKLIRAALNGDEKAKRLVLDFVDFCEDKNAELEKYSRVIGDEDMDDDDSDDDDFWGYDFNITLPRSNVKEYLVHVKLNNIDIKIWREVKVPSNITLEALANLLLDVMGWGMEHLYSFQYNGKTYCSDEELIEGVITEDSIDYSEVTLSDVLTEKSVRMKLHYDYGDDWSHDVWVKGIREYDKDERPTIELVDGHGECPPENCGGVRGYSELLMLAAKKRKTRDDKERLEWYGIDKLYDPEYFDIDDYIYAADDMDEALQDEL